MFRIFSAKIASALVLTTLLALVAPYPASAGVAGRAGGASSIPLAAGWQQAWGFLRDLFAAGARSQARISPAGPTVLRAKDGSFIDPNGRNTTASAPLQPIGGN